MNLDHYELRISKNISVFEFVSKGPKGNIDKIIQFSEMELKGFYNLAFGDKNIETGELDDSAISNNGDMDKVLASVVESVLVFTKRKPEAIIYATSSTVARTRAYRMGISKYYEEIVEQFDLYRETESDLEQFVKGREYKGFVVLRKTD